MTQTTDSNNNMRPSRSASSAKSIVTTAAESIQFSNPTTILENLEKEAIQADWQLEYLDSHQWQNLGVPMGLVAAIRRSLEEKKHKRSRSPPCRSSGFYISPTSAPTSAPTTKSKLLKQLGNDPSMFISLDGSSSELVGRMVYSSCKSVSQSLPQDCWSTVGPPTIPQRQQSSETLETPRLSTNQAASNHNHNHDNHPFDYSFNLEEISAPTVVPARLESIDRDDSECLQAELETSESERTTY